MAERAFTDREGLSNRPWYKHLVSNPLNYGLLLELVLFRFTPKKGFSREKPPTLRLFWTPFNYKTSKQNKEWLKEAGS